MIEALDAEAALSESARPIRKRGKTTGDDVSPEAAESPNKKPKADEDEEAISESESGDMKPISRGPMSKTRETRLEQNRKAARESRRRKKTMIEELQRSVIFFSRANSTLKQQNDELTRMLMQAQSQVSAIESGQQLQAQGEQQQQSLASQQGQQQQQAHAVAQQAAFQSEGIPAAAARMAAQTMNAGARTANDAAAAPSGTGVAPVLGQPQALPQMQTGATMQAMANFQQAAAAAMASAMMMNPAAAAAAVAPPPGFNPQQESLNALAMQQVAAAAASGQQFAFIPQMMQIPGMVPMNWAQQQPNPQATPAPAPNQPNQDPQPGQQAHMDEQHSVHV